MKEPQRLDVTPEQIQQLMQRARERSLAEEDYLMIAAMGESILFLRQAYEDKRIGERRLLKMLFGPSTESLDNIQGVKAAKAPKSEKKKKARGHGRRGARSYPGAQVVAVSHNEMKSGDRCLQCKGKVYEQVTPGVLIRFKASVPIDATVYELEKLRCGLCGEVYTAPVPEEAGKEKYDETVGAMIGTLKYGYGLPFHRIEKLQQSFGIPLPASTQWEIVDRMVSVISPAYEELIRQAAQGEVIHNDDTTMKILALMNLRDQRKLEDEDDLERTGCFTSGFLSTVAERKMAVFFTGEHHAGENMEELLKKRNQQRDPPIQMCDALSRNLPKSFQTILGNCMSHARRHFVDVFEDFPTECRHVMRHWEPFIEMMKLLASRRCPAPSGWPIIKPRASR